MKKVIVSLLLSVTLISCGDSSSKINLSSTKEDQTQNLQNPQNLQDLQASPVWTGTTQEALYYLESTIEEISEYVLNAHNIYFVTDNNFYSQFLALSYKNLAAIETIAKNTNDQILEEKAKLASKKIYVLDDAFLNIVGNEKINKDNYPSYIDTSKLFQLKLFYAPACAGLNQELYFMCIDQNKLKNYIRNLSDSKYSSNELWTQAKSFSTWYRDHTKVKEDDKFKTWMYDIISDNIDQVVKDSKISDLVDGAMKDKPWFIRDLSCSEYILKLKEHDSVQQPLIIKKLEIISEIIDDIKNSDPNSITSLYVDFNLDGSISIHAKDLNTPIVSLTKNGSDLSYDETNEDRQASKQAIEQISEIISSNFNTTILLNFDTFSKYQKSIDAVSSLSTFVVNAGWEDLHDQINEVITSMIAYYDFYRRAGKFTMNENIKQNIDRCAQAIDQINEIVDKIVKK